MKKILVGISAISFVLSVFQATLVFAASNSTFSQTINAGSQSIDIVDADGNAVGSPSVTFGAVSFSFSSQTATGTLGAAAQKIRIYNPTSDATWSVAIAATSGATAVWTDGGSNTYDFNDTSGATDGVDADSVGGQLTIDAQDATTTLTGVSSCATTNMTYPSSTTAFVQGTTDSVTLITGGASAATFCRWDLTDIGLSQVIPASQAAAAYTLSLTLTIS